MSSNKKSISIAGYELKLDVDRAFISGMILAFIALFSMGAISIGSIFVHFSDAVEAPAGLSAFGYYWVYGVFVVLVACFVGLVGYTLFDFFFDVEARQE